MTSMTPRPKEWTFRRVVAELPFIPAVSNWLKLLFSLLAEPLMFLSSLYIIAQTLMPDVTTWPPIFLNGTKTVIVWVLRSSSLGVSSKPNRSTVM